MSSKINFQTTKSKKKKTNKQVVIIPESESIKPTELKIEAEDDWATIILEDINISALDRAYVMPDIQRRQEKASIISTDAEIVPAVKKPEDISIIKTIKPRITFADLGDRKLEKSEGKRRNHEEHEIKAVATSLEKLGISTIKKEALDTIYWGERYKIRIFASCGEIRRELTPEMVMRCHHCHQFPPKGALMLGVPFKYVPSYIHRHDYTPEWVNVVKNMKVERTIITESGKPRGNKTDQKSQPKTAYLRRDLPYYEVEARNRNEHKLEIEEKNDDIELDEIADNIQQKSTELVELGYFETIKPVCSFSCMLAKGLKLSEHDPRFRNVQMLAAMMYQKIFEKPMGRIAPAAPFENLLEYGGTLTLDEYRKEFRFVSLNESGQIFQRAKKLISPAIELYTSEQE